ncbi:hypothetical protein M422DRAFT_265068 [Sphaerobolus stellatus SS14]|uniref:Uncharacterized protein n=1 Tax=Sphaerobolus stellatus (strain SS14) TaxID=990650 RepID=A0A0C9TS31_SPHS4|nr:hypothetical protein M422DRAFT_265068 [Sphaerobolus stellatus SS14]
MTIQLHPPPPSQQVRKNLNSSNDMNGSDISVRSSPPLAKPISQSFFFVL